MKAVNRLHLDATAIEMASVPAAALSPRRSGASADRRRLGHAQLAEHCRDIAAGNTVDGTSETGHEPKTVAHGVTPQERRACAQDGDTYAIRPWN